jgi:molybdopterin-guanine dinucleotide biosynthesis protein A
VVAGIALGILAGGRGQRFGCRDKGWIEVEGRAQIERVLAATAGQADHVMVSANRNLAEYRALGVNVVEDLWPDHPGPLAGIASLMRAMSDGFLLTLPVDAREIPADFAERMAGCRGEERFHVVVAQDDDGLQPLFALYPAALAAHAAETLEQGRRSVREWQHRFPVYPCVFEARRFGNLNTPEDLSP